MVMKKEVQARDVVQVISKAGGRLIESIELFDVYEGDKIGEGLKSLAYSIVFRDKERTLSDNDVNPLIDKIIEKLKEKGVDLRS